MLAMGTVAPASSTVAPCIFAHVQTCDLNMSTH